MIGSVPLIPQNKRLLANTNFDEILEKILGRELIYDKVADSQPENLQKGNFNDFLKI